MEGKEMSGTSAALELHDWLAGPPEASGGGGGGEEQRREGSEQDERRQCSKLTTAECRPSVLARRASRVEGGARERESGEFALVLTEQRANNMQPAGRAAPGFRAGGTSFARRVLWRRGECAVRAQFGLADSAHCERFCGGGGGNLCARRAHHASRGAGPEARSHLCARRFRARAHGAILSQL